MTRRKLIIGAAVILAAILVTRNIKNLSLPSGNLIQNDLPSSSLSVSPEPLKDRPQVEISTPKGVFVIELRPDLAPKTITNFLSKWVNGYCDGKTFHRIEDWVVQGCDPKGDGTGGNSTLPTETSDASFTTGSLGVALSYQAFGTYIQFLYIDILGLKASLVGIGWSLYGIWNAVNDPLAGYWSDNTRTRWGRRIPWIVGTFIPVGLFFYLLWVPPSPLIKGGQTPLFI